MTPLNELAEKAAKRIVASGEVKAFCQKNQIATSSVYYIAKGEVSNLKSSTAYMLIRQAFPNVAVSIDSENKTHQALVA